MELNVKNALEVMPVPTMILLKNRGENLLPFQKYSITLLNSALSTLLSSWAEDSTEEWKKRLTGDLRFINELDYVISTKVASLIVISFEENQNCKASIHPFGEEILCVLQPDSVVNQKENTEKEVEKVKEAPEESKNEVPVEGSHVIHLTKKRRHTNLIGSFEESLVQTISGSHSSMTDSENELQEHIGLVHNLAETVPHLTWMASGDGVVEYFNQRWYDYTGQCPSEAKGHSWISAMHPDDSQRTFDVWTNSLTTGEDYNIIYRIKNKEGEFEWFEGRGAPFRDKKGRIIKWFGTCTNANERIKAEKQREEAIVKLKEMENRYRKLTESELVGVFIEEKSDGRVIDANSVFWKTFGCSDGREVYRRDLTSLEETEKKKELEETGVNRTYESIFKSSNGEFFPVLVGTTTLNDHQYLSVFSDISALKHAERVAIEATKAKSSFIANVSHEIRTPLNGVCGMTELLFDSPLTESQKECVQIIKKSSEILLMLINNILDFSKMDVGKMKLERSEFDVQNVVEDIIDLLGETANSKGIELLYLVKGMDNMVIGDPGRLRQILINLVNNAIKFTERGEVVVEVNLSDSQDRSELTFRIKDSGIGITEDDIKDLFKPFVQLDNSLSRKHTGTGLGLTICRQLVELFGGKIGVESVLGKGSTFWFTIQVEKSKKKKNKWALPSNIEDANVMISANNERVQSILAEYLNSWNVNCVTSSKVSDALQLLRDRKASKENRNFDVIFADSANAFQLSRAIESDPDSKNTKLVLIGYNPLCIQSSSITSFLPKPVRQSKLFDILMRSLDQQYVDQSVKPTVAQNEPVPSEWANMSVLMVEDNAVNVRVASRQLEKLGVSRIVVAGNGVEALSLLEKSQSYSVIFMDCQMPVMDGITATKEIRQREKILKWEHIPIIAMTANVLNEAVAECTKAGMDDYITKPVKIEYLGKVLRKWCPSKPSV